MVLYDISYGIGRYITHLIKTVLGILEYMMQEILNNPYNIYQSSEYIGHLIFGIGYFVSILAIIVASLFLIIRVLMKVLDRINIDTRNSILEIIIPVIISSIIIEIASTVMGIVKFTPAEALGDIVGFAIISFMIMYIGDDVSRNLEPSHR